MDKRSQWVAFRGRLLVVIGVASLIAAVFASDAIPEPLVPLVTLFGIAFILLAIPTRVWGKLPRWFHRDDTWL